MVKRTIKIKNHLHIVEEYVSNGVITPGMLLALRSDGKVQAHGVAQGKHPRMFALEDELQGRSISDNYAATEPVQVMIAQPGEQVYGILKAGQNVAVGDYLVSGGDGTLIKASEFVADPLAYPSYWPVGIALEALDLSGSGAVASHLIVGIV